MMESSCKTGGNNEEFLYIKENYLRVTEKIACAANKAGKNSSQITLLGATKTVPPEVVNYAISLGLRAVGENRVQELLGKYDRLQLGQCDCQFIGKLQTNKIKYLLGMVSQIQSIDTMSQVRELARLMKKRGELLQVLVEVNIGEEPGKGGVSPGELYAFIDEARSYIPINGLMAIPPISDNCSNICDYFLRMKQSFIDIEGKKMDNVSMNILSMGMSNDFAEAIACGANMVRVGSALFGKRNYYGANAPIFV